MKNKLIWIAFIVCISGQSLSQTNYEAALAAADSSAFSINHQGGWQLYNSYVAALADSVQLEIIVQHDKTLDWNIATYIGKINNPLFYPQNDRVVLFNLINTVYELKVDKNGKCYLRLVSGGLLSETTMVIPVKIFYKT